MCESVVPADLSALGCQGYQGFDGAHLAITSGFAKTLAKKPRATLPEAEIGSGPAGRTDWVEERAISRNVSSSAGSGHDPVRKDGRRGAR